MSNVYYITNWPYHECKDAAKAKKMHWVKAKVDFIGDDWLAIAGHKHAAEALTTWEVLRGIAQISPWRGLILTDGTRPKPHTIESLFAKTRLKKHLLRKGLSVLINLVGWVNECKVTQNYDELSQKLWGASYGSIGFTPENGGQIADKLPTDSGQNQDVFPPLIDNITGENRTEHGSADLSPQSMARHFQQYIQGSPGYDYCVREIEKSILRGVKVEDIATAIRDAPLGSKIWDVLETASELEQKRKEKESLARVLAMGRNTK